jgi:hypothetical protein
VLALRSGKMYGRLLVGKKTADQTLPVTNDPATVNAATDKKATAIVRVIVIFYSMCHDFSLSASGLPA